MDSRSQRGEGIRIIAEFSDRAVVFGDDVPGPVGKSDNEGVRMVAVFGGPVLPLGGEESAAVTVTIPLTPAAIAHGADRLVEQLQAVLAKVETEPAAAEALKRAAAELAKVG
jgi:hypothetical protein